MPHLLFALFYAIVIPIHGTALGPGPAGTTILRTDTVTGMVVSQTRAFIVQPRLDVRAGTGIDAFLDRSKPTWRLYDAHIAARFEPGLPETGKVIPIDLGSPLPHTSLVDQGGRIVDLAGDFPGRVVLLAFVFTRCPDKDECPTVTAKFAALSRQLDPQHFHLVEISLDPAYDSPEILRQYARRFAPRAAAWSILTGQPQEVQHMLDRFGISSLLVDDDTFLHNEKIFVTTPEGKIADIVQTSGFSTGALAAQARHLAGLGSNPMERWKLALVASAVALCGGSQFAGVVLLETVAFLIIAVLSFITLGWVARKIWRRA